MRCGRGGWRAGLSAGCVTMLALGAGLEAPARADDFSAALERGGASVRSSTRGTDRPERRRMDRQAAMAAHIAQSARSLKGPDAQAPLPDGPVVLVVSLKEQRLSVYADGKLVETTPISTGTASDPTPSGVFAVIEKAERHFSNLYSGAPMPFMQRLTMSGVALHSGYVTGRPASHGCVRLPHEYSKRLFKMTRLGARVIISDDNPAPVDIERQILPAPSRSAVATQVAAVTDGEASTGPGQPTATDALPSGGIVEVQRDRSIDPRTGKPKGPYALQRDEVLAAAPVSILVSRADGRVYVRHMFEPMFEMPITIAEPSRSIGTHVFTLVGVAAEGSGQRWSAVSVKLVPRRLAAIRVLAGPRSRAARAAATAQAGTVAGDGIASTAAEAIERVSLPAEITARIGPLLRPGASLIVTDLPQSKRTQTGWTDVIVTP